MYNSERMMKAIGNISDDKIEKVSRALGYQRSARRPVHAPMRMGRVLSIAAVVALILALGVTAYAIYIHWSRGMEQRLPATDTEKEMAEQSGLSDTSQIVSATANGVTISVEQTIIDGDTAEIALRIEGWNLDQEQELDATLWGWMPTFDGESAPASGGSFVEERDANPVKANKRLFSLSGVFRRMVAVSILGLCKNEANGQRKSCP